VAKSPRGMGVTPAVEAPSQGTEAAELPAVELIGLSKVPRGWVVVAVTVRGDKVIEREVLSKDPEPKSLAGQRGMAEWVKAFMAPKAGGEKQ
jgi:hypothetical protein